MSLKIILFLLHACCLYDIAHCLPLSGEKLYRENHSYVHEVDLSRDVGNFSCCPSWCGPLECADNGDLLLRLGHCSTFEEDKSVYIMRCPYFQLSGRKMSKHLGYIHLPSNISELNDYMCKPMNRKGFLCKDCIDGFGPSITSVGYACTNCTNAWYGVPLYILMQLLPVTFFCAVIFILPVRLTSAPLTCFIMYSQLIILELVVDRKLPVDFLSPSNPLFRAALFLYGVWNLDFFRYILPPFCVSSSFQLIHIALLDYISIITPLFLIILSWVCVELHGRNCQPLVCLWKPLHKCLTTVRRVWNGKADIIDVFATFLLLSYSKLVYQSYTFLDCTSICSNAERGHTKSVMMMNVDVPCWSTKHFLYTIPTLIVVFLLNILPTLLLLCYPVKIFRRCLTKCKVNGLFLVTFIERFQGCYKDGLDGGRDLRSFSALYLLLRYLPILFHTVKRFHITNWQYFGLLFSLAALLMACVKPYKNKYMNILDTLLLAHISLVCQLLMREWFSGAETQILIILLIPALVFGLLLIVKLCSKLRKCRALKWCIKVIRCCQRRQTETSVSSPDVSEDELMHPTSSTIESFTTYGAVTNIR